MMLAYTPLVAGPGEPVAGCTRFLLIRHAQTDWNRRGLIQGQANPSLDDVGRAQARTLARRLTGWAGQLTAIFASDLARAVQTAQILAEELGTPVHQHPGLREQSLGRWQGQTAQQLQQADPALWQEWVRSAGMICPPGGETSAETQGRMVAAIREIARSFPGQTVGIVSHGAALKAFLCWVLEVDLAHRRHFALANASVSAIVWHAHRRPVLQLLNWTAS